MFRGDFIKLRRLFKSDLFLFLVSESYELRIVLLLDSSVIYVFVELLINIFQFLKVEILLDINYIDGDFKMKVNFFEVKIGLVDVDVIKVVVEVGVMNSICSFDKNFGVFCIDNWRSILILVLGECISYINNIILVENWRERKSYSFLGFQKNRL